MKREKEEPGGRGRGQGAGKGYPIPVPLSTTKYASTRDYTARVRLSGDCNPAALIGYG